MRGWMSSRSLFTTGSGLTPPDRPGCSRQHTTVHNRGKHRNISFLPWLPPDVQGRGQGQQWAAWKGSTSQSPHSPNVLIWEQRNTASTLSNFHFNLSPLTSTPLFLWLGFMQWSKVKIVTMMSSMGLWYIIKIINHKLLNYRCLHT